MEFVLPHELIQSLEKIKGFEREAFMNIHHRPAPVSIRLNPFKKVTDSHIFQDNIAGKVPWSDNGYYLAERPIFTLDPVFHAGAYYVQEASSMFIEHIWKEILTDRNDLQVVDVCAAPGGKTSLLSSMPGIKFLLANEIIKSRVSILYENVVKWGDPRILVSNNDPADIGRLGSFFDVMLIDAPCSGSGLFRKDKDAIEEWSPDSVKLCSERQKRILADAMPALKEEGILMYSTCSYSQEENEDIMDWLITSFEVEPIQIPINQNWGIIEVESEKGGVGYRFMPYLLEGEGFFIACFRKKNNSGDHFLKERKPFFLGLKERNSLTEWISQMDELEFFNAKDDHVFCIPADIVKEQMILAENLLLRKSGVLMGTLMRGQLIPEHELTQSTLVNPQLPQIQLDLKTALDYLRKATISLPDKEKGWYLVNHKGYHLGWIKHLGNRINNYYPAAWRILMS